MLERIYTRLHHRPVRDLAWALLSPSLFAQFEHNSSSMLLIEDYIDDDEAILNWLLDIDKKPALLIDYIEQRSQARIGIYFEQLFGFYFNYYPRFELLHQNLQVQGEQRTLGEFDFIVFDKKHQQYLHIESAVKFYLGHYDSSLLKNNIHNYNWHQWIGPNKKDSLSLKMYSMLNKQLRLSETHEACRLLQNYKIPTNNIQLRVLLRGRFFCRDTQKPQFANKSICQFRWYSLHEFTARRDQQEKYIILPRTFWLSPVNQQDANRIDKTVNTKQLKQVLESDKSRGIKTWKVIRIDKDKDLAEQERFFIADVQDYPSIPD